MTERLEYLRDQLRNERISTDELLELQSMASQIDRTDVELLEPAGVSEFVDVRCEYSGIAQLYPESDLGEQWLAEHVAHDECVQTGELGPINCERNYAEEIVLAMLRDGLTVTVRGERVKEGMGEYAGTVVY